MTTRTANKVICVLSGDDSNVGKSTLSKLMKPYLEKEATGGVKIVAIESEEKMPDGHDLKLQATEELMQTLMITVRTIDADQAIILDVGGGTNFASLSAAMSEVAGERRYSKIIVPVSAEQKQDVALSAIADFVQTRSVDPSKIVIVLSRVKTGVKIDTTFKALIQGATELGCHVAKTPLFHSTLIARMRGTDMSIEEMASDEIDYDGMIASETDQEVRRALAQKDIDRSMAQLVKRNLDKLFTEVLEINA